MTETSARSPQSCPHRQPLPESDDQVAVCDLLREIVGFGDDAVFRVGYDACCACCGSFPPSKIDLNPAIASLLFSATEAICEDETRTDAEIEKANELNLWAERSLPAVSPEEDDSLDDSPVTYDHLLDVTAEQIGALLPRPAERFSSVKQWAVGVTTTQRRIPTLETCVESVVRSGWSDPVLFIDGEMDLPDSLRSMEFCQRKPALGAFPNFMLSLAELYMRQPHADAYLMLQDDAQLLGTPAMRAYLEQALWFQDGPCIASLYCSRKYSQDTSGWHRFEGSWVWGAVAFVFSRDAVRQLLTSSIPLDHRAQPGDEGLSKVDVLLGYFATENKIPIYFPSPSLVQHFGTISTIWKVARAVNARRADQFLGDLIPRP